MISIVVLILLLHDLAPISKSEFPVAALNSLPPACAEPYATLNTKSALDGALLILKAPVS